MLVTLVIGKDKQSTETSPSFAIVEVVSRGSVSSGIETTGEIIAAQKLDLDVYTQTRRIELVNVVNGQHVEADTVLFSFDKSDAMLMLNKHSQVNGVGHKMLQEDVLMALQSPVE